MKKQLIYISIYMVYLIVIILEIKIKVNFEGLVLLVIALFSFAAIGYHFALLRFTAKTISRIINEEKYKDRLKSYLSSEKIEELESKGWKVSDLHKQMNEHYENR